MKKRVHTVLCCWRRPPSSQWEDTNLWAPVCTVVALYVVVYVWYKLTTCSKNLKSITNYFLNWYIILRQDAFIHRATLCIWRILKYSEGNNLISICSKIFNKRYINIWFIFFFSKTPLDELWVIQRKDFLGLTYNPLKDLVHTQLKGSLALSC